MKIVRSFFPIIYVRGYAMTQSEIGETVATPTMGSTIVIRAKQTDNGREVRYNMADDAWSENTGRAVEQDQTGMYVHCTSAKGFQAKLRLQARKWA